jgi:hypothetical protein
MAIATEALYGSPKVYVQPEPPPPDDLSTRRAFAALLRYTESWTDKQHAAQLYAEIREIIPDDADFHYFCILSADNNIIPTAQGAQIYAESARDTKNDISHG